MFSREWFHSNAFCFSCSHLQELTEARFNNSKTRLQMQNKVNKPYVLMHVLGKAILIKFFLRWWTGWWWQELLICQFSISMKFRWDCRNVCPAITCTHQAHMNGLTADFILELVQKPFTKLYFISKSISAQNRLSWCKTHGFFLSLHWEGKIIAVINADIWITPRALNGLQLLFSRAPLFRCFSWQKLFDYPLHYFRKKNLHTQQSVPSSSMPRFAVWEPESSSWRRSWSQHRTKWVNILMWVKFGQQLFATHPHVSYGSFHYFSLWRRCNTPKRWRLSLSSFSSPVRVSNKIYRATFWCEMWEKNWRRPRLKSVARSTKVSYLFFIF